MVPIIANVFSWGHCVMVFQMKIVCGDWWGMEYCLLKIRFVCVTDIRSSFYLACETNLLLFCRPDSLHRPSGWCSRNLGAFLIVWLGHCMEGLPIIPGLASMLGLTGCEHYREIPGLAEMVARSCTQFFRLCRFGRFRGASIDVL